MKDSLDKSAEIVTGEELIEQISWLKSIVDSVHEGVIVTDVNGKILLYNKALERLEDLSCQEVKGKYLEEVYNVDASTSEHYKVAQTGQPIVDMYKTYFTREGKEISLVASTYPVFNNQRLVAVYSLCRDISKIRGLLSRTMEMQEQLTTKEKGSVYLNGTKYNFSDIIGESFQLKEVLANSKKAAEADCAILIYGETGTGKELFVQSIHNQSPRKEELFVAINCAAIPETLLESCLFGTVKGAFTGATDSPGLFEQAGGGTLFLDEINSMGSALQAKLLRVIQEKTMRRVGGKKEIEVNCRIISATNEDPWESIQQGTLRKDLYYRLAVISLYIPSLRERSQDIGLLLDYFVEKYSKIYGQKSVHICSKVREFLLSYNWPGNVRELEHVIESSISMLDQGSELTMAYLPVYLKSRVSEKSSWGNSNLEQKYYSSFMSKHGDVPEEQ
ncbi:MAG: sigma 54-interacting transcriptional regulator, partial [Bacillota bacterium]|nr:sigma 54-interacting transcriptional regulator [Bacillota bacterium]